jgi:hypothetical protein
VIVGHTYRYVFTACCDSNDVLYFAGTGTLTGTIPGVYVYEGESNYPDGSGNFVQIGKCYTITQEPYTGTPSLQQPPLDKDLLGVTDCNDALCPDCNTVCGECPPGYTDIGNNECEKVETSPATYSGSLLTIAAGDQNDASYGAFGLRLYPDISGYTLPLIGSGSSNATYAVKDSAGSPLTVTPVIPTLKSTLWGSGISYFGCGPNNGRLNQAGIWTDVNYPQLTDLCFEFCVNPTETKQYTIGIAGDNKVKLYIDNVLYVFLDSSGGGITVPFTYWHVFPVTLTAGQHTIRLCGQNIGSSSDAAFAGEIYDLTTAELQDVTNNLITPATGFPDCGSVVADLEPYILFSTENMIGNQIPDPDNPGVWSCPDGSTVDYCQGTPQCSITTKTSIDPCPSYFIIPCDGSLTPFYSTSTVLASYVGDNIQLTANATTICAWVFETDPGEVVLNPQVVTIPGSPASCTTACESTCYYISGATGIIAYVDTDGNRASLSAVQTNPFIKICSRSYPYTTPNPNLFIQELGQCDPVTGCPILCFKLTNCENPEQIIYSQSQNLISYSYNNQIVKLSNEEGCWTVEQSEVCECAVDVTIVQYFDTCLACVGYKNYKLTNCDTGSIKYTTNDLSSYVGQVVEISENDIVCPGCWSVTLFTQQVTVSADVTVVNSFINCKECQQEYWLLEDCANVEADIITITDLSIFEDEYIRLTWCPDTCWHVTSTRQHTNPTIVFLEENYTTCAECLVAALPCICVNLRNTGSTELTVDYYDCDGEVQSIVLLAGQLSDKICIKQLIDPSNDIVKTEFGDCTGVSPDFMCPVVPTPKRSVTPGYNTPGCSPEYFETVYCHFSSWIYGEVLKERYGISPCCSEDALKWEIRQQMLEFTIGINPEYDCVPASTCCGSCGSTPSSCNCN